MHLIALTNFSSMNLSDDLLGHVKRVQLQHPVAKKYQVLNHQIYKSMLNFQASKVKPPWVLGSAMTYPHSGQSERILLDLINATTSPGTCYWITPVCCWQSSVETDNWSPGNAIPVAVKYKFSLSALHSTSAKLFLHRKNWYKYNLVRMIPPKNSYKYLTTDWWNGPSVQSSLQT